MELRLLRYFIAVAEEEHITRGAERLGMQQPPLSQQIKALESELDVQLFSRKPRGVELTNAGRVLFAEAKMISANLDRAVETTRRTARGEQARLCVGIAPTAPFHSLVPRAIRAFREAFPLVGTSKNNAPATLAGRDRLWIGHGYRADRGPRTLQPPSGQHDHLARIPRTGSRSRRR